MVSRLGSRSSASFGLLVALFAACGASSGRGASALVLTSAEPPGENCSGGGVRIEVGVDADHSGVLDRGEIDDAQTRFVCNGAQGVAGPAGAPGPAGLQGEVGPQGERGPVGPEGAQGSAGAAGPAGPAGPPGAQGPAGPIGPAGLVWKGVWDGGASYGPGDVVTDGASSFVAVASTLPGDDPAFGPGTWELVAAGGLRGEQGPTGPTGPAGPQGIEGATGAMGPQGPSGPMGPVGPMGSSALIRTAAESAGANCATGGTRVQAGSDANGNGVLDAAEVNAALTRYVCNGAQGPQGIQGPQGPSGPPGTTAFGTSTNAANAGMPGAVDCVLGTVSLVAGNAGPGGMVADGRLLSIQQHPTLFAVLGDRYGGDGSTTFALPDLTSAAPNKLSYVICTDGYFPMME